MAQEPLSQMNKSELVREAKRLGVDVPGSGKTADYEALTVGELRDKIREAREDDRSSTPADQRGAQPRDPDKEGGSTVASDVPVHTGADPNPAAGASSGPGVGLAPGQEQPSGEEAVEQLGAGLTAPPEDLPEGFDPEEAVAATQPVIAEQNALIRARQRADSPEARAKMGLVMEVANKLAGMDFSALKRLESAVAGALLGRGQEPETPLASELDVARVLPLQVQATTSLNVGAALEAIQQDPTAPQGLEVSDLSAYSVRQATNQGGQGIGPAYVVGALLDGRKLAGRLG
jgi:hypothetical protein